ncbi:TPA: hypothetical protein ACH3X1_014811, partial [Trebouxia sp. C0004]
MGCCRHGTTTLKFVTGTHKLASKHVNPKTKRLHTGVGQDEYHAVIQEHWVPEGNRLFQQAGKEGPRSGRPHKASAAGCAHGLDGSTASNECTSAAVIAARTKQDVEVLLSRSSVTRILKRKGIADLSPKVVPLLTAMQKAARIKFARAALRTEAWHRQEMGDTRHNGRLGHVKGHAQIQAGPHKARLLQLSTHDLKAEHSFQMHIVLAEIGDQKLIGRL